MKLTHFNLSFSLLIFLTISSLKAEDIKAQLPETKFLSYNIQDRPSPNIDNPLKGMSKFLFFPMSPAKDKAMADRIFALAEKKLSALGQVNRTKTLVNTDQGEGIDLSVFSIGTTLVYLIQDLKDLSGKDTGFIRASLNLSAAVQVVKTTDTCSSYVWSCNCFLKGSTQKNLENLISTSLDDLLKQFSDTYNLVNSDKPLFELQGAE
ncbi:MAG: hypothetical protein WCG14_07635 [Chlamydiia bacterium]